MPKVRASSATIGTMRGPSALSFSRPLSMRTRPWWSTSPCLCTQGELGIGRERRHCDGGRTAPAPRQVAAQDARRSLQIAHLAAVLRRAEEAHLADLLIGERKRRTVAECASAPRRRASSAGATSCATRRRRPCRSPSWSWRGSRVGWPLCALAARTRRAACDKSWPPRVSPSISPASCARPARAAPGSSSKKCSRL